MWGSSSKDGARSPRTPSISGLKLEALANSSLMEDGPQDLDAPRSAAQERHNIEIRVCAETDGSRATRAADGLPTATQRSAQGFRADGHQRQEQPSVRSGRRAIDLKGVKRGLREHPFIWLSSFLVVIVLAVAGVLGVMAASNSEARHRRLGAQGFANNAAVAFSTQLEQTFTPLVAMAAVIQEDPHYSSFAKRFPTIAEELLRTLPVPGGVKSLQVLPQGVVRAVYPMDHQGREAMGHNMFKDPTMREAALETVRRGGLTLQEPTMLKQGFMEAIARVPVFIRGAAANQTSGVPELVANCTTCPDSQLPFWGFVSCVVDFELLMSGEGDRLKWLSAQGYSYQLVSPRPNGDHHIIAQSPQPPQDPVQAVVSIPNGEWLLLVSPEGEGWLPVWLGPMVAVVVVVSCLMGVLMAAVLVSRNLQLQLNQDLKATNRALEEEKQRTDVLLARQYNLISCLERKVEREDCTRSQQQNTLDRIEDLRREIGLTCSSSLGVDELLLDELLGEGSFGKVHKGVWRGSAVAVKSMVLPANMSGSEKRERMAIMEAAISSAMQHPNIVQTYTYIVKPSGLSSTVSCSNWAATTTQSGSTAAAAPGGAGGSTASGAGLLSMATVNLDSESSAVHGVEVALVLEYCDWGCLRDALDAGAFFTSDNRLNYAAILDTAADVARAMLHVHNFNVIHSDLKGSNVLLKSDGSSGRGVVAKVADFGLAVRINGTNTHVSAFQGTMSHMAPEALLQGRLSKAADVYAFGVTLWELFTAGHAHAEVPHALLGHQVTVGGLRPCFPPFTPGEYRDLAQACWAPDPNDRPDFAAVLAQLQSMRAALGPAKTPPLTPAPHQKESNALGWGQQHAGEDAAAGRLTNGFVTLGPQQLRYGHLVQQQQQQQVSNLRDLGICDVAVPAAYPTPFFASPPPPPPPGPTNWFQVAAAAGAVEEPSSSMRPAGPLSAIGRDAAAAVPSTSAAGAGTAAGGGAGVCAGGLVGRHRNQPIRRSTSRRGGSSFSCVQVQLEVIQDVAAEQDGQACVARAAPGADCEGDKAAQ